MLKVFDICKKKKVLDKITNSRNFDIKHLKTTWNHKNLIYVNVFKHKLLYISNTKLITNHFPNVVFLWIMIEKHKKETTSDYLHDFYQKKDSSFLIFLKQYKVIVLPFLRNSFVRFSNTIFFNYDKVNKISKY